MKRKITSILVILALCFSVSGLGLTVTPSAAQAADISDLVAEMNNVYPYIDDTYRDGSLKTDKAYLADARIALQNLSAEAYNSANWNSIIDPLITALNTRALGVNAIGALGGDAATRQKFVQIAADIGNLYYTDNAAELNSRLTTFKNDHRATFQTLFGDDISIDQFAQLLIASRQEFTTAINHALTAEETAQLLGTNLRTALISGTDQQLADAMPILVKYAMLNAINDPANQLGTFSQRLDNIGLSIDLLIDQYEVMAGIIDPNSKAKLALALASVRSQSWPYNVTGANPTVPIPYNSINCSVGDTFSIQLQVMDTDVTGLVDYAITEANQTAIEITNDQGNTIDFRAAAAGSARIWLYRQNGIPQHDWLVTLDITVTPGVSSDATLASLSSTAGSLSPAFDPAITDYMIIFNAAPNPVPTISASANHAGATFSITQAASLSQKARVVVTAENGTTTKTYYVGFAVETAIPAGGGTIDASTAPVAIQPAVVLVAGEQQATLPDLVVTGGPAEVTIPDNTTVTGPAEWNGTIVMPVVKVEPSADVTGTGIVVVEVGAGKDASGNDIVLTFDKAVRLVIPGQKGKTAAYTRNGNLVIISDVLSNDSQATADNDIPAGEEAYIDVGNDKVIWTKHFTEFVTYTPTLLGGGGGGGGGGVVSTGTTVKAAEGGKVTGNGAIIDIPANALASDVKVKIEKVSGVSSLPMAAKDKLVSDVLEITKDKTGDFQKAVTITLTFDKSKIDADKYDVALYWLDTSTSKWVQLDNVKVDMTAGKVSGDVNHFTKFAVIASEKAVTPPVNPEVVLADIAGHWAEANIKKLVTAEAIAGYPDKTFKPDNTITRAEFAVTLVKALKLETKTGKVFTDTANHWAKDYIATANAYGIINGYSDTAFGPDDVITREQMAVMIVKAAKLTVANDSKTFTDNDKISSWSQDAVNIAVGNGIMSGYPDGSFKPQGSTTRAEAMTVMSKIIK
jgi:hypothetical protein